MNLPEGFLDELKGRIGLPEVIGKTVKLARRGRQFLGLCPFHGEKTPSFHVYDDHYHCFGCGAHGSVIDFVMQAEKVGFPEAVERLAAQAGMTLPSAGREKTERERPRGSLYDVLEAAAAYYQKLLRMPEGKPAVDYLRLRGVGEVAIQRFRLGYAPDGRFAIKAALVREGFTEETMIEAGLLVRPEDASRGTYDRFRGRLMFPIADRRGRVVGFGGRILGTGEPKYLNSPETPLFHKGRLLYNSADGSKAARDEGTVIVVEGYMDVIGLVGGGVGERGGAPRHGDHRGATARTLAIGARAHPPVRSRRRRRASGGARRREGPALARVRSRLALRQLDDGRGRRPRYGGAEVSPTSDAPNLDGGCAAVGLSGDRRSAPAALG